MELLVDLGISEATKQIPHLTNEITILIRDSITKYLNEKINYDEARDELLKICGNTTPIDKIIEILSVSDIPIEDPNKYCLIIESGRKKMRAWTPAEDLRLLSGIHKFGKVNWARIAVFVGGGRTRSQCAQRWTRSLDPQISKTNWSFKEEELLIHLVRQSRGNSWRQIAKQLGNRSDVQCRYHFKQLMQKKINQNNVFYPIIQPVIPKTDTKLEFESPVFSTDFKEDVFDNTRMDIMMNNDFFW